MPKKKSHHIIGKIKHQDVAAVTEHPTDALPILPVETEPEQETVPPEAPAPTEPEVVPEDHVVVAVPESLWKRFTDWIKHAD